MTTNSLWGDHGELKLDHSEVSLPSDLGGFHRLGGVSTPSVVEIHNRSPHSQTPPPPPPPPHHNMCISNIPHFNPVPYSVLDKNLGFWFENSWSPARVDPEDGAGYPRTRSVIRIHLKWSLPGLVFGDIGGAPPPRVLLLFSKTAYREGGLCGALIFGSQLDSSLWVRTDLDTGMQVGGMALVCHLIPPNTCMLLVLGQTQWIRLNKASVDADTPLGGQVRDSTKFLMFHGLWFVEQISHICWQTSDRIELKQLSLKSTVMNVFLRSILWVFFLNQKPGNRGISVECDQKLTRMGAAHNQLAHQILAQSNQQFVCRSVQTIRDQ